MIRVRAADLVALRAMVLAGASHKDVGFEDTDRTLPQLNRYLDVGLRVNQGVLESALWSASLMEEAGVFVHPEGNTFGEMLHRIVPKGYRFDRMHHLFIKKAS